MRSSKPVGPLAVAALGVVFGDIGTSPLYTLQTCFTTAQAKPTLENALGIVSLLVWTLVLVVCVKYVTVLMRIDHDGEGGILALLARAEPPRILGVPMGADWLVWVVVIGGAMIIGDGMIHARNLGHFRRRGSQHRDGGGAAGHRPALRRHLARAVRHSVSRDAEGRRHLRPGDDRMVCRPSAPQV